MERASRELVNRLKKMHIFLYKYMNFEGSDDENDELTDDLEEVVKDAYKNFISKYEEAMGTLDCLLGIYCADSIYFTERLGALKKEMRFLRTSFRCLMKCCIEMKESVGWMDGRLIYHLGRVETQVVNVATFFSDYAHLSPTENVEIRILILVSERLNEINDLKVEVGIAYSLFTKASPSNYFMNKESVDEFLDQVLENFRDLIDESWRNYPDFEEIQIFNEALKFLRSLLQFVKDKTMMTKQQLEHFLICIEAVADKAAHMSFMCWAQKTNILAYYEIKKNSFVMKEVISDMYNRIWKSALIPLRFPFTDELLVQLVGFLSHHLTLVTESLRGSTKKQVQVLYEDLMFLKHFLVDPVAKHFVEKETQHKCRVEIEDVMRKIGSAISPSDCFGDNLGLSNLLEEVGLVKDSIIQLQKTPLSDELLIGFLHFLHHNLIELPKDCVAILKDETMEQLEILKEELCFLRHFLTSNPKNYTEKDMSCERWKEIDGVVRTIGSVICPHFNSIEKESIATAITNLDLYELLKNIRLIKASLIQIEDTPLTNEVLMALVDCVHKNLIGLLKDGSATLVCTTKDQFQILDRELWFLRRFIIKTVEDQGKQEELCGLRIEIETVARKIACVTYSNLSNEKKENLASTSCQELYEILKNIRHIKTSIILLQDTPLTDELLICFLDCVQNNLIELLADGATTIISPVKDQFEFLSEELQFFVYFLTSYPSEDYPPEHHAKPERLSDVKSHLEVVARKIVFAMLSPFNDETKDNIVVLRLSPLIQNIKLVKAEVMEIVFLMDLHRIRSKSPKTDQLGFLNSLLDDLKELICHKSDMIMEWKDQIQAIHDDLEFLRSYVKKIIDTDNADGDSKDLSNRIRIAAYEVEYLINSFMVGACPMWCRSLWISGLLEQIKLTKGSVMENMKTTEKNTEDRENDALKKDSGLVLSPSLIPTTDVVVGFTDEIDFIKQQLVTDRKELDLVSIIGMPGLGKTTLAKKVYDDRLIVDHFYVRAWCNISQEYQKRDLILSVLGSTMEITDLVRKSNDANLAVMLHKELMGRRYLIVLDDVWTIEAWEDLSLLFPDNNEGSRIILTSRNKLSGAKYYSDPLELRFLTDDESWDLLQKKVYGDGKCPQDLYEVGKEIAAKCKGLPLAVVIVAGLLAKSNMKRGFWEEVAGNLSSYIAGDSQRKWMDVLELSYKLLPDYLKPLFLFLGIFPEDREIPTNKLVWLWIAEGFVRKTKLENLELQAEFDLKDLIDRSLVIVAERRYNGRVKTCRVHDLIRDLCLAKAQEENFLRQIHAYGELSDPIIYGQQRLNISLEKKPGTSASPLIVQKDPLVTSETLPMSSITPSLRSLLIFNTDHKNFQSCYEAIKSTFGNSKLLRLLHSESITMGEDLCPNLVMLFHLRYISLRVSWNSIPLSISNLWKLETLIIKGSKGEIVVPAEIWKMAKLRHLHVNDRAAFKLDVGGSQNSSRLKKLETLSTASLSYGEEKKLLVRLPNVRKLSCIFFGVWDPFRKCNHFPHLELLDQLESLKAFNHGRVQHPSRFYLPSSLRKLTLSKFRLKWSDVLSFRNLPNLEALKLLFGAVDDAVWDMEDIEFPKLKYLKLERLNIKQWDAYDDNFPCLEKLILERCKQLTEIPSSLGDIVSLEKIELLWCNAFAVKSAKQILEEQEYKGNPLLKVHIYPPSLDSEPYI